MIKTVDDYLERLKKMLAGCDPALIQDALTDTEDHLCTALQTEMKENPERSQAETLSLIIEKYGNPEDTATSYRDSETRIPSLPPRSGPPPGRSWGSGFFSVFSDARAWGAFLYMLFAFVTGIIYGFWTVIGLGFSLAVILLIIGIPLTALFLLSLRGLALIEGRIVEALLGTRMPRKPLFIGDDLRWTAKLKALFTESHTWRTMLYLVLQFPLGMIYSLVIIGLFIFSLGFISSPVLELVFGIPLDLFGDDVFTPVWLLPIITLVGFVLLPVALHLARFVGRLHGRYAKYMLVRR